MLERSRFRTMIESCTRSDNNGYKKAPDSFVDGTGGLGCN
jgi:hypothetical protein